MDAIALVVHHEHPLTEPQYERLFASGGRWLQRRRLLADALANGMTTRTWGELPVALFREHRRDTVIKLTIELPLARRRSPPADVVRAAVENALAAGAPCCSRSMAPTITSPSQRAPHPAGLGCLTAAMALGFSGPSAAPKLVTMWRGLD